MISMTQPAMEARLKVSGRTSLFTQEILDQMQDTASAFIVLQSFCKVECRAFMFHTLFPYIFRRGRTSELSNDITLAVDLVLRNFFSSSFALALPLSFLCVFHSSCDVSLKTSQQNAIAKRRVDHYKIEVVTDSKLRLVADLFVGFCIGFRLFWFVWLGRGPRWCLG